MRKIIVYLLLLFLLRCNTLQNKESDIDKLFDAVKKEKIYRIKRLIINFDLKTLDTQGNSILDYAFKNKNPEKVLKILIDSGIDIKKIPSKVSLDETLYKALIYQNEELARILLENGANLDAALNKETKSYKEEVIYKIFDPYNFALINLMLEFGLDINSFDPAHFINQVILNEIEIYKQTENIRQFAKKIKILNDFGLDLNKKSDFQNAQPAVFIASKYPNIFQILLDFGADINIKNNKNEDIVAYAVSRAYPVEVLNNIEKNGIDVISAADGLALLEAVQTKNNESVIKYLIAKKIDINKKDIMGNTAFSFALNNNCGYEKILLKNGYKVRGLDIAKCINTGNLEIFDLFLSNREKYKITDDHLNLAFFYGLRKLEPRYDILKKLLDNDADINAAFTDNNNTILKTALSPLMDAVTYGIENYETDWSKTTPEKIKFLIENGAEVNIKLTSSFAGTLTAHSNTDKTVIELAEITGHKEIISAVRAESIWQAIENGNLSAVKKFANTKNINIKTVYDKNSLLMHAFRFKQDKIAEYLIDTDINLFHKNKYKDTPLHFAVLYSNPKTVNYLCQKLDNEAINFKNEAGWTPYYSAKKNNKNEILKILLKAGAIKTKEE